MRVRRQARAAGQQAAPFAPAAPAAAAPTPVTAGGLRGFLAAAEQEGLVVTHWFEPAPHPKVHAVTIRFVGTRLGVAGKPEPRDRFVHEETIEGILADGGSVAVSARVTGINLGEWRVTSEMRPARERGPRRQGRSQPSPQPTYPAAWSWRRWSLSRAPRDAPVKTGLLAFAFTRVPAVVPGVWGTLAVLGTIVGLTLQAVLISRSHLAGLPVFLVSVTAVLAGGVGAKVWFIVLKRRERKLDGWCIQGFLTAFLAVVAAGLAVSHVPVGAYLDTAAPGLLLGMAVGRVGCFFAGCCYGRPTASRWGIWSSDQRVGVRRVPTQLVEASLALALGLVALGVVLAVGPLRGGVLVAALAVYTGMRQGILRWRGERRQSSWAGAVTAGTAAVVLVADAALVALRPPWLP